MVIFIAIYGHFLGSLVYNLQFTMHSLIIATYLFRPIKSTRDIEFHSDFKIMITE